MAISSQFENFIRWAIAFLVIYKVFPSILFPILEGSILEKFFTHFTRMLAITIIMGYILVALKLYEVLAIVFVFILLLILINDPSKDIKHIFRNKSLTFLSRFFDFFDDPSRLFFFIRHYVSTKQDKAKQFKYSISLNKSLQLFLLFFVLAFSTYLRFYDTLRHAAPSMSDSYVILAWMKYINGRVLFHDGIYPEGFFIYLSFLHKFAGCDALYILKYSGPLHGVLTTVSIYLFVAKITGNKLSGILSAFVFGVLGAWLPYGWERQGATLTQEFALVFLFPAWYYSLEFLQTRNKQHLWTAAAAFAVIALVHTLILVFLWVGIFCLLCACLLFNYEGGKKTVKHLILAGIVTGVVAAIPLLLGMLVGMDFHGASLEFMQTFIEIRFPQITIFDMLALVGFVIFLLSNLTEKEISKKTIAYFIFFLGVLSWVLYYFLAPISGNMLLLARTGVLWALVTAVGIGVGAETILRLIPSKLKTVQLITTTAACLIIFGAVAYFSPSPSQPYKMQYDLEINQYLRIAEEYPPAEWTLVSSNEGYDLALGKGWHINLSDFLAWYDPNKRKLSRNVDGREEPLVASNLFIFHQKKLFVVDMKEMEGIMAQRVQDYANLEQWVIEYQETHDNLRVFYEDDFISIYHIQSG